MNTREDLPQTFKDDSIDLIVLLQKVYVNRKLIFLSAIFTLILGIFIALATPNSYTSGATFIPQTSNKSNSSTNLSGLASLAGINVNNTNGGSDIPSSFYPQIIASIPYKLDLLDESIRVSSKVITLREYLSKNNSSLIDAIKRFTINLPSTILETIKGSSPENINEFELTIYEISGQELNLFETLNKKLNLYIDENDGFVTLEFSDENQYVSAQVAEFAKDLLQNRIIEFKNQSARELLESTTKQYQKNKTSYEALQDSIAIFKDQNLNISSSLYQNRLDRLERDLNIASSVVEQLASQVEQAKLQVNKDTPVFTIIEPVTVPFEKSAPKRSLIVVIWTFLGVVLSTGFVLVKDPAKEIIASIRK